MPRHVVLLRHAKSSWDDSSLADFDRPLAPRGRRATEAVAEHVEREGLAPDLVLCSPARRAVETLEGVRKALPDDLRVSVEDDLYGATAGDLLRRLRRLTDDVGTVLLVGHNPAVEDLARGLVGSGDSELLFRLETKFPTAAMVTLGFDGPWEALDWGVAALDAFVTPREMGS